MPRLRDKRTGVVVVVDDATAATLAVTHEPVDKPAPKSNDKPADDAPKRTARRTRRTSSK